MDVYYALLRYRMQVVLSFTYENEMDSGINGGQWNAGPYLGDFFGAHPETF